MPLLAEYAPSTQLARPHLADLKGTHGWNHLTIVERRKKPSRPIALHLDDFIPVSSVPISRFRDYLLMAEVLHRLRRVVIIPVQECKNP